MKDKYIDDFINSQKLFQRFDINTNFSDEDHIVWHTNLNYLKEIKMFGNLKVVNEAASIIYR